MINELDIEAQGNFDDVVLPVSGDIEVVSMMDDITAMVIPSTGAASLRSVNPNSPSLLEVARVSGPDTLLIEATGEWRRGDGQPWLTISGDPADLIVNKAWNMRFPRLALVFYVETFTPRGRFYRDPFFYRRHGARDIASFTLSTGGRKDGVSILSVAANDSPDAYRSNQNHPTNPVRVTSNSGVDAGGVVGSAPTGLPKTPHDGLRMHFLWQWQGDHRGMIDRLEEMASAVIHYTGDAMASAQRVKQAFEGVQRGQRHNPVVSNAYGDCFDANPEWFFMLVVSSSSQSCNLAGTKVNVEWQFRNNRDSIKNAQRYYSSSLKHAQAIGMYYLLEGQRHNPGVMDGYRACYRDNPKALWDIVNGQV